MPTDPADKYGVGKLLDYRGSTMDDEITPNVRVSEIEAIKKRTNETTDALVDHTG